MANLIVRNIEDEVANALKQQARNHGRSAEAEHRMILRMALMGPRQKPFAEVLAQMPNVGEDADFERVQQEPASEIF